MTDESKNVTLSIPSGAWKAFREWLTPILMAGGFATTIGIQQTGPDDPQDPQDKPVTVKLHRIHVDQEIEFRREVRQALRQQNEKLDFLYRLELRQLNEKKKYGMATK